MADDGGPVFPLVKGKEWYHTRGMSLRDYFAAAALQGRLANPHWAERDYDDAEFAYAMADLMLDERAK